MHINHLLAVAIPTYKRPELLLRSIESVVKACRPHAIPIYVYDDSLGNINDSVYSVIRASYPLLQVIRNEKNLGIDENIAKCVEATPSKYVWLLGEDDLFAEAALEGILSHLATARFSFIFINYSYVSNDYSRVLRERRIALTEDLVVSGLSFFENYLWAAGFIGGCMISTDAWKSIDRQKYYGTYFTHVGVIGEIIRHKDVLMVAMPRVKNRAENTDSTSWQDFALDVNFGWDRMLHTSSAVYPAASLENARKSASEIFWHRSLTFLISKRADNVYGTREWARNIKTNDFGPVFRGLALLIAYLPSPPLRFAKRALSGSIKRILKSLSRV